MIRTLMSVVARSVTSTFPRSPGRARKRVGPRTTTAPRARTSTTHGGTATRLSLHADARAALAGWAAPDPQQDELRTAYWAPLASPEAAMGRACVPGRV